MGKTITVGPEELKPVGSTEEVKEKLWDKAKRKACEVKDKVTEVAGEVKDWCVENKEAALTIGITIAEVGLAIYAECISENRKRKKEHDSECLIYDPHTGCRYFTKHPMRDWSRRKQDEFHDRIASGDDYYTVLRSIGEI